jgi:hypothetical protein
MRIARRTPSVQIVIGQKSGKCGIFKIFGWHDKKNDERYTREIKSRISVEIAAFNNKKTLFTSKLDVNLRKTLVKRYIWSIAWRGAGNWTLRKGDHKIRENFKCTRKGWRKLGLAGSC